MNPREYSELCSRLEGKLTEFSVDFMEIGILLGGIRLVLDHPDVEGYDGEFHRMVGDIRKELLDAYMDLGLTPKQVHDLNTRYAAETDSIANDYDMERAKSRSKLKVITHTVEDDEPQAK